MTPQHLLAQASRKVGWELLLKVSGLENGKQVEAIALSPLSITIAIAMLAGAADSQRQSKWCRKLGLTESLATNAEAVQSDLASLAEQKILSLANAVFIDRTVEILSEYEQHLSSLKALRQQYPSLADSAAEINSWISENTMGRINNMLQVDALRNCHVVLANAVAFKGTWKTKFDQQDTIPDYPFYLEDGTEKTTEMMFLNGKNVEIYSGEDYSAVRLPYVTEEDSPPVALVAWLPNPGTTLSSLINKLSSTDEQGQNLSFRRKKLSEFGFPKFKVDSKFSLLKQLEGIGFPIKGNYPNMAKGPNEVSNIIHQTFVKLDEEGTEAAAATAVMMLRSMPMREEEQRLVFDRPFLYMIEGGEDRHPIISGTFSVAK
ncbi:proteinase inhibitor I4 [Sarocladium strictum]